MPFGSLAVNQQPRGAFRWQYIIATLPLLSEKLGQALELVPILLSPGPAAVVPMLLLQEEGKTLPVVFFDGGGVNCRVSQKEVSRG